MKKKIILFLSILIVFVIGYFVYQKFFSKKEIKDTIKPNPPEIVNYFQKIPPISFNVDKKSIDIPNTLPILKKSTGHSLSESDYINIAKALNFSEDPKIVNGKVFGKSLIWNSSTNFLIIYSDEKKIKYGPSVNASEIISGTIDKQISDSQFVSLAENFLKEKIFINPDEISYLGMYYLKQTTGKEIFDTATKDNYQIIQLNFSFSKGNYPIYNAGGLDSDIYIQLLKDGTVLNFEIVFTNVFEKSDIEYQTKTFEDVVNSINEATIVSLDNGNINLPDLDTEGINNILIDIISIVYYLNSVNDSNLQPVFLLTGLAQIKGYPKKVNASLYLPAFK